MKGKSKQFLVVGLGRFGSSLAAALCQMGHEVLAVDKDEELVNDVAPFVTQAMQMDATDEAALAGIGVRNFDTAIVSIGQNIQDSILICVLLKELGIPRLIAKATEELHGKVLRKVGADRVVFPEREMGVRLAKSLLTPNVLDMMELSDAHQLVEVTLPEKWADRTIADVNVRRKYGLSILGLRRDGQFMMSPSADTAFSAGDTLLVLGDMESIEKLERA